VDVNRPALDAARIRAASHGVERQMILREADLNEVVPLSSRSFDVVISIDVVLHVQDRAQLFSDVARLLTPGGKFLFTDAAVMTGTLSKEEVAARSIHGFIQFSAPGLNESQLEHCGFRLLESEDRTASLLSNANGRLTARSAHWSELTSLEGPEYFARQQRYLETVIALAERGALTRRMYLAEVEDAA
jgi:cyclopropane fatty-acyl-phospholipid synthase-like methyltransferase